LRQHIRPPGTKRFCVDCPLFQSTRESKHGLSWCVPTEVNTDPEQRTDVMFIGTAPGSHEDEEGMVFTGPTGHLFRSVLNSVVPTTKGLAFTNLLKCVYGKTVWEKNPDVPGALRQCSKLLKNEIKKLNPKVIVLMGNHALHHFFPKSENILAARGRVLSAEYAGEERLFIPTIQPAAALRSENLVSPLRTDIKKALTLAKSGQKELPSGRPMKPYRVVDTIPKLKKLIRKMSALGPEDYVAIDYEGPNTNKVYDTHISTVQFCWSHDQAYVVPVAHPETPFSPSEIARVKSGLKYIFTNKNFKFRAWLAHNAKFEQLLTKADLGTWITNRPVFDTMALAFLMDENRVSLKGFAPLSLKTLAKEILEYHDYTEREVLEVRTNIDGAPIEEVYEYGCKDVIVTWRMRYYILKDHIEDIVRPHVLPLLEHLYSLASSAFALIERSGFLVDMSQLRALRRNDSTIVGRMREIERELAELPAVIETNKRIVRGKFGNVKSPWGKVSNVFSPSKSEHRKVLMFDVLGLAPVSYTKGTKHYPKGDPRRMPTTGKEVYAEYKDSVPSIALLAEWAALQKLSSAYLSQIFNFMVPGAVEDHQDGRIRPSIGALGVVTGRTNQFKPNLQQIPGRGAASKAIKNIFIVEDGRVLIQADYMANEVRWLGIASGDATLSKMFRDGFRLRKEFRKNPTPELAARLDVEADIHRQVASQFFNIPIADVRKDVERFYAKSIIFGAMYGRSTGSISRQIGVDYKEGEKLVAKLWDRFPDAHKWLTEQPRFAQQHGFVLSPIGRPRRLPAFWTGNEQLIARAGRLAQNSPIQGVASDATIIGCGLFAKWLWDNPDKDWKLINMVHDSFMIDAPMEDMFDVVALMEEMFTNGVMDYMSEHLGCSFNCPLEIDFEIGLKWGSLQKWDFNPAELQRIYNELRSAA